MTSVPALQFFFDAERRKRGWSMRDLAEKSQISISKAYAIANGDDNVEFETFENIAAAFNLSPAELAAAIGKGPGDKPAVLTLISRLRGLPDHDLAFLERLLSGFSGNPSDGKDATADYIYQTQNRSSGISTRLGVPLIAAGVA